MTPSSPQALLKPAINRDNAMPVENPFLPLSLIAGPAILTNACAIMQNSASIRYSLAITQWREFRASIAEGDNKFSALYLDPPMALKMAERRVRRILLGLSLLYIAVAMFGLTTFLALGGALINDTHTGWAARSMQAVFTVGGVGLMSLVGAMVAFLLESSSARAMIGLHPEPDYP